MTRGRNLRSEMLSRIDTLIDFGHVITTALSVRKNVLMCVEGAPGERADGQPLFSHAAVLVRPAPPTDDGSFEVVYARVGEEMVVLANRDTRWQVDLEEGEVVVRSLGETAARIYLKPDGKVIVEASEIQLGSADASEAVAIASKVNERLDAIARALDALAGATAVAEDGGAALQAALKSQWSGVLPGPGAATAPADTGATKVKAE